MKRIFFAAVAALAVTTLSSCLNEDINSANWSSTVVGTLVSTDSSNGMTILPAADVMATVESPDVFTSKINFTLADVRFVDAMPKADIQFRDLPFVVDNSDDPALNGAWVVSEASAVPFVNGTQDEEYTVRKLTIVITDKAWKADFDFDWEEQPAEGEEGDPVARTCHVNFLREFEQDTDEDSDL